MIVYCKFITKQSRVEHLNKKYPLLKILKAITMTLFMNEFEILILAYYLERSEWKINENLATYCLNF